MCAVLWLRASTRSWSNRVDPSDRPREDANDERPLLILHAGPPKTGSTTLQCALESLRAELESDGVAYVGRPECPFAIDRTHREEFRRFERALVTGYACHKRLAAAAASNDEDVPSCWREDLLDRLDRFRKRARSTAKRVVVLFSDEALANRATGSFDYRPNVPYPWEALDRLRETWEVRVLVAHRPLHAYWPSVYAEMHKPGPGKARLRRWAGTGDADDACPREGGRVVPGPFDDESLDDRTTVTIARLMRRRRRRRDSDDGRPPLYPDPASTYEVFRDRGHDVTLVDVANADVDAVEEVVCSRLPRSVRACAAQRARTADRVLNPSGSLHHDVLAVEACRRGVLNGTRTPREAARRAVRERTTTTTASTPPLDDPSFLICPDRTTFEEMLCASLDHERRLRGPLWSEETTFEREFWRDVLERKRAIYCALNTTAVLEDPTWRTFLKGLATTTTTT